MNVYDFKVKDMSNNEISLSEYKGKTLVIVNTATKCGYTKQYNGLEALYKKYKDKNLEILDFPCNQFLGQAPGDIEEIHNFCTGRFGITFKQFAKIEVNGKNEDPLYTYLKNNCNIEQGKKIRWNFTKFLVDKNGNIVNRYDSKINPEEMENDIKNIL
ncbi:MAG: glutathione peroxidase [Bacilli bacterium]|nr:glutathione peroxidase [Bacilli bacterium]